jgi:poly-beta-1,6-N-acetyl-D-glucosamine synthase
MVAQTHRPTQWVIVDDGSTDDTAAIAASYAAAHDWIQVVPGGGHGERARGAPIVRAFKRGLSELRERPDITVKLDGDLFFASHYFHWVAQTFARDPRAGVVGGVSHIYNGSRWVPDVKVTQHVNGVAKAYRTSCLEEIGGLPESMGWDGIDEYSARARGWKVYVLTELTILHYRLRGSKQPWYRARWEEGRGNHYMGYVPAFLALRAGYRMVVERPPVLGGLALAAGFAYHRLTGAPQVEDTAAMELLREEQRARLRGLLAGRASMSAPAPPGGGPALWPVERRSVGGGPAGP